MYVKQFVTSGLNVDEPIFFDTETLGLYGRTRLVQVRQGDVCYEYDCYYVNIEEIKTFFKDCYLVFHNSIYDLSCPDFKQWLPKKFDDTMLLARQEWPYLDSFSLGNLAEYWKLQEKGPEASSDWSRYNLSSSQLDYASMDTRITEQLFNLISKETFELPNYKLDIENIRLACVYQWKGMKVSHKNCKELIKISQKELKKLQLPEELNVNSSKQVREFLGVSTSNKDFLSELSLSDKRAGHILLKRMHLKRISYLQDMLKVDFATSKINPVGAVSGRFISRSSAYDEETFNLQQIPRELKRCFAFNEGEGYYVCADYPALEVWVACAIIGDEKLFDILHHNRDLHTETAASIFNTPIEQVDKKTRGLGKCCNFSLMYGAGVNTLKHSINVNTNYQQVLTDSEATELKKKWHNVFKGITAFQRENFDYFNTNKYRIVQTPMGRKMKASTSIQAINYPIQGGGAECTKLALMLLGREGIIPANTVHDSICLIASNQAEAEEYAKILKWCMEEAYRRVIKNCRINTLSLNVDVDIGLEYC